MILCGSRQLIRKGAQLEDEVRKRLGYVVEPVKTPHKMRDKPVDRIAHDSKRARFFFKQIRVRRQDFSNRKMLEPLTEEAISIFSGVRWCDAERWILLAKPRGNFDRRTRTLWDVHENKAGSK
jgi:hypothetical protein